MEGRSIGGPPGDICIILLQAVMEKAGADFAKVKVQNMDAPTRIPMLAAGRIDAAGSFYEKEVMFEKAIKGAGKKMVTWRYDQFIEKYSVMVVVSDKMIKEKPDVLRKFTLALLRGYQDHLNNSDAAAATIMQAHPRVRQGLHPQLSPCPAGHRLGRDDAGEGDRHAGCRQDAKHHRRQRQVLEAAAEARAGGGLHQRIHPVGARAAKAIA
jgi:ABC-type nitrate/sulfonate/bicarbonate transport system substrate-binding protein